VAQRGRRSRYPIKGTRRAAFGAMLASMLFHIEQSHSPADCPYGQGGSRSLHDASAAGVEVKGIYGAFTEHVIFLLVEADDIDALHLFLAPGMKTCATRIRPVSEHAMPHPSS
jgi:hypothetical protein